VSLSQLCSSLESLARLSETRLHCLPSRFSVSLARRSVERHSKAFDDWLYHPGYVWTFVMGERPLESKRHGPFEILSAEQRMSFLDGILQHIPRPLINMVGSLLPAFAGYKTKRMLVSQECVPFDLPSCMCNGLLVVGFGDTVQFWDVNQSRMRAVVSIACECIFASRAVGEETVAIATEQGTIAFVGPVSLSAADVKCSSTPPAHDFCALALAPLRDGRLVSGSLDCLLVWRRKGATWHDGVVVAKRLNFHPRQRLRDDEDAILSMEQLPNGKLLGATSDGWLNIWSLDSGQLVKSVETQHAMVRLILLDGD